MSSLASTLPISLSSRGDHAADGGVVELWFAHTDRADDLAGSLAVLADGERARAQRFRFRRDRDRFVARRAFVRRVLAGYVGVAPANVGIRVTTTGRPELEPPSPISFNASHSDGLAVVAVAVGRRVGVDIERVRDIEDVMGLASAYLSRPEIESLRSAPPESRSAVFLSLWTRKESVVKAIGGGLSIPLDSFDTSRVGDDGVGRPRGTSGALPFAFASLPGPEGYAGAVTVGGSQLTIREQGPEGVAA